MERIGSYQGIHGDMKGVGPRIRLGQRKAQENSSIIRNDALGRQKTQRGEERAEHPQGVITGMAGSELERPSSDLATVPYPL